MTDCKAKHSLSSFVSKVLSYFRIKIDYQEFAVCVCRLPCKLKPTETVTYVKKSATTTYLRQFYPNYESNWTFLITVKCPDAAGREVLTVNLTMTQSPWRDSKDWLWPSVRQTPPTDSFTVLLTQKHTQSVEMWKYKPATKHIIKNKLDYFSRGHATLPGLSAILSGATVLACRREWWE